MTIGKISRCPVLSGCCVKMPKLGVLYIAEIYFSQNGGWKYAIRASLWLGSMSGEGLLFSSQVAFFSL